MLLDRFGFCLRKLKLSILQGRPSLSLTQPNAIASVFQSSCQLISVRSIMGRDSCNTPEERNSIVEKPISEECLDSSRKAGSSSSSRGLTLKSLLSKKTPKLYKTSLPCKFRVLKYPHKLNQRSTQVLSILTSFNTWNNEVQNSVEALHVKLSCKVVREVIKSLSDVRMASSFFQWATNQKDFKHNTKTYSAIVRLVGESGDLAHMNNLLIQMHKEGCPLTPYFLADIMMVYGKLNMVEEAILVFNEMESSGCPPNRFVYNCLISILTRGGYLEGSKEVHNLMWKVGGDCLPDAITYNMLIDKHGKTGDILEAKRYCIEMKKKGMKPNEKSYASLIGSLSRAGKIDKACELFDDIKNKSNSCRLINRVTYTELIRGLGKAGNWKNALQVFREMESSGCSLDVVVYNIMIDVLVRRKMVTEAWKMFVSMQAKQCQPNVVTYNSLILGFCFVKKLDVAFRWYEDMQQNHIKPDNHTHAILINGLCKTGKLAEAYQFLMDKEKSQTRNMSMNVVVHNAMLDGLVKAGEYEAAFAHFKEMEGNGCLLDVFSYSIIIHGFGNSGKASDALDMYKKMKKSGLRPNLVTFNTLIHVLGKAGMIFEVHEIVEEMTSLGYQPDVITYTSLLPVVGKDSKSFRLATKCRFDHVLGIRLRSSS